MQQQRVLWFFFSSHRLHIILCPLSERSKCKTRTQAGLSTLMIRVRVYSFNSWVCCFKCCRAPQPPLRDVLHEENKAPSHSMDKAMPYQQICLLFLCMNNYALMSLHAFWLKSKQLRHVNHVKMMNIDCRLCRAEVKHVFRLSSTSCQSCCYTTCDKLVKR